MNKDTSHDSKTKPKPKKKPSKDSIVEKKISGGLTEKQRSFVDNYILTGNKERAAILAGYSKKTAYTKGYQELSKVRVKEYYEKRVAEIISKNNDKISLVMSQLLKIATCDITDYVEANGQIKDLNTVDGQLIQSIKHTRFGPTLTLASKEKALELLGRFLGMYSDKIELSADKPLALSVTFQEVVKPEKKEAL